MPTVAQALQAAAAQFAKNAKESLKVELDGSCKLLMLASAALQQYHSIYEHAVAAEDADVDKFVREVSSQAAAYVCLVFLKAYNAQVVATKQGDLLLACDGVTIPVGELMVDEVKTGKGHSVLLIKRFDEIHKKNAEPRKIDPGNLETEVRASAAIAVQDVRASLKQELDGSLQSLAIVDRALLRLKTIAEVSPESKSNLVRASCEKYGSYIGEVLVKHLGARWVKLQIRDQAATAVELGSFYVMPSWTVEAVLEGKKLDMGDEAVQTVCQFAAITEERMKTATPDGLFRNLDTPGEVLKRIQLFADEGVRIAKGFHNIDLDYSLFSLSALNEVVAKQRKKLDDERQVLSEENFQRARAFSALPLGAYLGEVILRAHGGSWEDAGAWPRLRQHIMKLDPITVVGAFLRGEIAAASEKRKVSSPEQYYQGVRPLLHDTVETKLIGSSGSREQLLAQMGPKRELNSAVLHFASYVECDVELDFSEHSLLDVDRMLEQFHKSTPEQIKAKPVLERENLCKWFGCYAGEVFRRSLGGVWADDASGSVPAGPGVAHLQLDGNRIFVLNKVGKFLDNGPADSVAFLLSAVRQMKNQGQLGPQGVPVQQQLPGDEMGGVRPRATPVPIPETGADGTLARDRPVTPIRSLRPPFA